MTTPDRTARVAVAAMFLANGVGVASFLVRIPDVRDHLGLREAALGLVLSSLAIGVVTGLVLAGRVVGGVGSRRLTFIGGVITAVALPVAGAAPTTAVLVAALLVTGAASSLMDVGMNAQGVGVERGFGRSIMLGFHGAWSIGTLLAAMAGSIAMGLRIPVGWHLLAVSTVIIGMLLVAVRGLRVEDRVAVPAGPRFAIPRGPLFPLALVAFAGAIGEATATDWSGIHLADNLQVASGQVGWGFVAYNAAMTVVRLVGDAVVRRIGARWTIAGGGVLGGIGFLTVAVAPVLPVALIGFACVGLGMGVTVPLAFSAAGNVAQSPGAGVAAVGAVGYLAFIIGPSAVGLAADLIGLPIAFVAVGILVVVLTLRPQPALQRTR